MMKNILTTVEPEGLDVRFAMNPRQRKSRGRPGFVVLSLAIVVACVPSGEAQPGTEEPAHAAFEHMADLQPFLGSYATTMGAADQRPAGTLDVRAVMRGQYVEFEFDTRHGVQEWQLRLVMTWDAAAGAYRIWRFDTRAQLPPGENEGVARLEGDQLVMEWPLPAPDGSPATFRNRAWMASVDTLVIDTERELASGEVQPLVRTVGRRMTSAGSTQAEAEMRKVTTLEILLQPSIAPDHRVAFGPGAHEVGELRLPDGDGPHPVAVLVHGGCWRSFATLRHFDRFAEALTDRGLATWNIAYRKVDEPGGGWPGTFLDVAAGVDHVRDLARDHPLDLDRVFVIGHSAGGHLATWAAARPRIPSSSPIHTADPVHVAAVVNLAGPPDLEALSVRDEEVCGMPVIEPLVGGSPDEVPTQYAAGSPGNMLPLDVPQLHLVGELDALRPFVEAFAERARDAGDDVVFEVVPGAGHHDVIAPWSAAWSEVPELILRFVGMGSSRGSP